MPQIVILAHTIAPDVAAKLLHFDEALETARNGHAPRVAFSDKVQALIEQIRLAVQPSILEAGERAFNGLLPLCYKESATPEEKRQAVLHRGLLALLIHYSPLRRRQLAPLRTYSSLRAPPPPPLPRPACIRPNIDITSLHESSFIVTMQSTASPRSIVACNRGPKLSFQSALWRSRLLLAAVRRIMSSRVPQLTRAQ